MNITIMKRLGLTVLFLLLPVFALATGTLPTLSAFDLVRDTPSWGLIKGATPTGAIPGRVTPNSPHGSGPAVAPGNVSSRVPMYQKGEPVSQSKPTLTTNQTLSVIVTGSGTVHTNLADIDCRAACGQGFKPGSELILTANPDPGYRFDGWSGGCSGTENCAIVMDQHKSVGAIFSKDIAL